MSYKNMQSAVCGVFRVVVDALEWLDYLMRGILLAHVSDDPVAPTFGQILGCSIFMLICAPIAATLATVCLTDSMGGMRRQGLILPQVIPEQAIA